MAYRPARRRDRGIGPRGDVAGVSTGAADGSRDAVACHVNPLIRTYLSHVQGGQRRDHAAAINLLIGTTPTPNQGFDRPLTKAEVLAKAGPLIKA